MAVNNELLLAERRTTWEQDRFHARNMRGNVAKIPEYVWRQLGKSCEQLVQLEVKGLYEFVLYTP